MTESVAQQTMGTSPRHETTRISDALNNLEESANSLKFQANNYKQQLQAGTGKCTANVSGLSEKTNYIIEDINNNVKEIVKFVRETRKALEGELKDVCEAKEKDINTETGGRERFGRRPMQCVSTSCEGQYDGYIEIVSDNPMTVTCYQTFHVEIAHTYNREIDNDLTVSTNMTPSSKQSVEDMFPSTRIVKTQGKYFIKGSSSTDFTLHVKFRKLSIKGSPIKIIVEPVGIVRSISNVGQSTGIMGNGSIQDLVMSENGSFLIACNKREVFKFRKSGAFVSKIQMGQSSFTQINRICKLKNNNLICCDWGKRRITYLEHNSKEITSTSTGFSIRSLPSGVTVDEDLNVVYVADETANCVRLYDLENNLTKSKTFGCYGGLEGQMNRPSDVAVTKKGNIIVADTHNHRVQLFGSNGKFIKVLIGGGDEDGMVIMPSRVCVDYDDNIIVVSECKVQLFDKDGNFLRVIHKIDKAENKNFVISIVSHYPRRLAMAEVNSITINVINY